MRGKTPKGDVRPFNKNLLATTVFDLRETLMKFALFAFLASTASRPDLRRGVRTAISPELACWCPVPNASFFP